MSRNKSLYRGEKILQQRAGGKFFQILNSDALVKNHEMAKQKFRPTRRSGFSGVKAYIWYVEVLKKRCNAIGRTFCNAIDSNITAAKVRGEFAVKIRPGDRPSDPPHVQSDKNIEDTPGGWFVEQRGEKSSPEAEAENPD
ncbi:MAG: hypothetical protein BA864_10400 [Desulfuromonadales bacterium C00003093]|nr:MAG: hypothetical protein BA864_10400 [Desulfuromonadales bacterium C00003093]